MFRTSLTFRNLAGVTSPYLCVHSPEPLREVLVSGRTRENIDLIMNEVVKEHMASQKNIFPETRELCSAAADLDRSNYSAQIDSFLAARKANVPLFQEILFHANESQIYAALKYAVINQDLEGVKIILPFVKNKQKTVGELFIELRNKHKISLEMIKELLPSCSRDVQSKYLKEMIIQGDKEAVKTIVQFFKPTQDHRTLAKNYPSIASMFILKEFLETKVRSSNITGIINISMVEDIFNTAKESGKQMVVTSAEKVFNGVKQSGKQMVVTARQTAISVARKLGLLSGPTELVPFATDSNLGNLDGLVPNEEIQDERSDRLAGEDLLQMSLAGNERISLSFAHGNARLAITGTPLVKEYEEEMHDFELPKMYGSNPKGQSLRFGHGAIAVGAILGSAALLSRSKKKGSENDEELAFLIDQIKTGEESAESLAQIVERLTTAEATQPVIEETKALADPVIEESKPLADLEAAKSDAKPKVTRIPTQDVRYATSWEGVLRRMEADDRAGLWVDRSF